MSIISKTLHKKRNGKHSFDFVVTDPDGVDTSVTVKTDANMVGAALLELGSGFDGDLTVRENTYLRGAMLGYTRKFMDEMYQQIIDFAELREFEDRPFKQLSSGMKSRLAFSIASLVQPDILILDEATSSIDTQTELLVQEGIDALLKGRTSFVIAHRLSTIQKADRIFVIDHGGIVEEGSASELLAKKGAYYRLHNAQLKFS